IRHNCILGNNDEPIANIEIGPVEVGGLAVGRDADTVTDAGVLVDDRALDDGVMPDADQGRAGGAAALDSLVIILSHDERIANDRPALDSAPEPDERVLDDGVV